MMMRRKGVRRVAILLAVTAALGAAGGVLAIRHHRNLKSYFDDLRRTGMQEVLAGDYSQAIDPLEKYLREHDEDTQAAIAYAQARYRVEAPRNEHLGLAIEKLDGVLKREPDNLEAKHILLKIYPQIANKATQLGDTARDVLAVDPNDESALRGLISVRLQENKIAEAATLAEHLAESHPDDLTAKMIVLQLMYTRKRPIAEIQAYADKQYKSDPNDARLLFLQAYAANYANDVARANTLLEKAAANPSNDPEFIRQLALRFDQLKRFNDSRALLEKCADQTADPEVQRILIARLWQNGRYEDIVKRLANLDAASRKSDIELVAMRALAQFELKNTAEAKKIVADIKTRKDGPRTTAWASALDAQFADVPLKPHDLTTKLSKAISRDPNNGIFRAWMAETYWQLGEASLAMHHWRSAAEAMPSWSKPFTGMSQCLLDLGRTSDAVDAAKEAFDRLPTAASAINLAAARFRLVTETADQAGAQQLINLIDEIQTAMPGEGQTLQMKISLLARSGRRDEAIALIDRTIGGEKLVDAETALRLVMVSRAEGLDRESAIIETIPQNQITPKLALTQAIILADSGKPADGLSHLQQSAKGATSNDVAWSIALAQYYDATNNPLAADLWRKIGDANPGALDVQRAILANARDLRTDRVFIEKTINHLKETTGPDAQQWKVERARWLVESPDVMKDGVEAVTILTDVVRDSPRQIEPRLQLAKALERTGNSASAIEHLREAQKLDPRSASVTLELVRMLQNQGSADQVRNVLRQLSTTAMTTAHQRLSLAAMFADVGETQRGIDLLATDEQRRSLVPAGRLLLADLYRRTGQFEPSRAIFDSLCESKTASTGALAAAAEFYATQNQMDRARATLARLAKPGQQNAEGLIATARFEERFGDPETALKLFRQASESGTEIAYDAFIDFLMGRHDYAQAIAIARVAQQRLPNNADIGNRLLEAQARAAQRDDPKNLQPLIDALSRDPARTAEVEVLRTLELIRSGKLNPNDSIAKLRTVADKFPRLMPLQEQLIEFYLQQKKIDDAVLIAQRTLESLPTEPAAARLAVRTFRSANRWTEMRLAAEQWKKRGPGNAVEADTAIAEALLEQKKPDDAIRQLAPHQAMIAADVRTQPQAGVILARAMLVQKNGAGARDLLRPLLKNAAGRHLWLITASRSTQSAEEANQWLSELQQAIPAPNFDERLALATNWTAVARRFDDQASLGSIATELQNYLEARPQDAEAWMLVAGIHQQLNQLEIAESELRSVLALKNDNPAASNDLACLLLQRGSNIDEAEKLATLAVQKQPNAAAFIDTLARVQLVRKQLDAARSSFEQALRLDPELMEARLGLARLLKEKGESDAAMRELQRVNSQMKANPTAGRHLEAEVAALQASMGN